MNPKKRGQYLARIDALLTPLRSRLGQKPQGWFHPPGLEHVWKEYASIRTALIRDDKDCFGSLPDCPEPTDSQREHAGYTVEGRGIKSIPALALVALRDAVEQALVLLTGGDSAAQLDSRERIRLENENMRLKNRLLAFQVLAAVLAVVGYLAGRLLR